MDSPGLCQFLESWLEPQWGLVTPQQKTSPYPPSREIFLLAICHQNPDLRAHLGPFLCISRALSLLSLWFWCLSPAGAVPPPNPIPGAPLPTAAPCRRHSWMGASCTLWMCKLGSILIHLTWSGQICSCKLPICLSLVQQLSTGSFRPKNPQFFLRPFQSTFKGSRLLLGYKTLYREKTSGLNIEVKHLQFLFGSWTYY